jgi:hypothetical protein
MRAGKPRWTCSPDGMFPVELRMASLNVLGKNTDRGANIFFRLSCQHCPMADDDRNSMSAILSSIRRAFAPDPAARECRAARQGHRVFLSRRELSSPRDCLSPRGMSITDGKARAPYSGSK